MPQNSRMITVRRLLLPQQVFPVVVAVVNSGERYRAFIQGHRHRATPKASRDARFRCEPEVMGVSARGNLARTAAIRR